MGESSRNSVPPADVQYSGGQSRPEGANAESGREMPELPESASPANNPALNRSAEAVGRSVGTAVAGVRRLPQQIDKLRSRIHVVGGREAIESRLSEIKDSAAQTVAEWRDSAEGRLSELGDEAELYAYRVTDRANHGLESLGRQLQRRIAFLGRTVRQRGADFRRLRSEYPVQVIGGFAVAGFVAGVTLRVWRSNHVE